jgi:hypothetical protein
MRRLLGTHETLEIQEFCFENNIILCRLPSHTSHKLEPCDISVFGPLKAAYRDQVERLERGCVGTVGKEHFTYLYSPARDRALTPRNIRAGWAKAGLFPFNPDKALCDIPKPPGLWIAPTANEVNVESRIDDHVPRTPSTPVSAGAVTTLQKLIQEDASLLDETNKYRLQKHLQKLTNAAQLSFAERDLLREHNQFLVNVNNEAKVRRSTKSEVVGTARVMSYEDLVRARVDRASKERAKEAKKALKEGKRKRGAHHVKPLEPLSGEKGCVRKRKSTEPVTHARATQAADNEQETSALWPAAYTCTEQVRGHNVVPMVSSHRAEPPWRRCRRRE